MKKNSLCLTLLMLFILCFPVYADTGIKIVVDEREIKLDMSPVNINGRLLVPVRAIFEALGAEVNWEEETQTVTALKGDTEIKLIVGGTASKNGTPVTIDVLSDNISGRVMVPLRFVSESLGAEVAWSEENQCAYIGDIQAKAIEIHQNAWLEVASKAKNNPNYKYALYASRTLAVKHPEYYLKGDALFDKYFRTLSERYYLERTQNTHEQEKIFEEIDKNPGRTFDWDTSFDIKNHKKVGYNIYHTEAFLPYVDMRLHFMGSALKGTDWQATSISKAEFLYFKYHHKKPYLLFTEDGTAYTYLGADRTLLNDDGSMAEKTEGNLVLVFNEEKVWYPLMERDDRDSDSTLEAIVNKYTTGDGLPILTDIEKKVVQYLKDNTGLSGDLDQTWALFFAGKLHVDDWDRYPTIYSKICPGYGPIVRSYTSSAPMVLLIRNAYVVSKSNLVCPAASYIAAIAKFHMIFEPVYIQSVGRKIAAVNAKVLDKASINGISLVVTDQHEHYIFNMDDTCLARVSICIFASIQDTAVLELADLQGVEYYSITMNYLIRSGGHAITSVYYKNSVGSFENLDWTPNNYLERNRDNPTLTGIIDNRGWILLAEYAYFNKPRNQILTNMNETEVFNTLKRIAELSRGALVTTKINPPNPSEGIPITEFIENIQRYKIIHYEW